MTIMWTILGISLTVFALAGAFSDIRTRRIPNALVLAGLVVALALRGAMGLTPLLDGLAAAGVALAFGLPLFALRAFGGGDVKFMVACAAFVGLPVLGLSALFAGAFGGLLAVGMMMQKRVHLVMFLRTMDLARSAVTFGRSGERMTLQDEGALTAPFGVAIAAGCLLAWFGRAGGWLPL
jgi:prepilin peptidase CpaA